MSHRVIKRMLTYSMVFSMDSPKTAAALPERRVRHGDELHQQFGLTWDIFCQKHLGYAPPVVRPSS
mgnify:CR=1 FL=1